MQRMGNDMGLCNSVYVTTKKTLKEYWCYDDDDLALEFYSCWYHTLLHDWMRRLYLEKGGSNTDFHFGTVTLGKSDLDRLEADIESRKLSNDTEANSAYTALNQHEDTVMIDKARRAIAMGLTVFYRGA